MSALGAVIGGIIIGGVATVRLIKDGLDFWNSTDPDEEEKDPHDEVMEKLNGIEREIGEVRKKQEKIALVTLEVVEERGGDIEAAEEKIGYEHSQDVFGDD